MRNQQVLRLLESRYGLLTRHARKVLEEIRKRMTAFDVVEQSLKRDSSADKNRRSAEDLGIGVYDSFVRSHRHPS